MQSLITQANIDSDTQRKVIVSTGFQELVNDESKLDQ